MRTYCSYDFVQCFVNGNAQLARNLSRKTLIAVLSVFCFGWLGGAPALAAQWIETSDADFASSESAQGVIARGAGEAGLLTLDLDSASTHSAQGAYVSSPFFAGGIAQFKTLSFAGVFPEGMTTRFQVRTSSDGAGLAAAAWSGPAGAGDYFTTTGLAIPAGSYTQWIQYRAEFDRPEGSPGLPEISEVAVEYELVTDIVVSADASWPEGQYRLINMRIENGATLTLAGGSLLNVSGVFDIVGNSALLAASKNASAPVDGAWRGEGVTIRAGNLSIEAGSKISADAQGYVGFIGIPGNGPGGGPTAPAGGSYGGVGANGGAPAYGSPFQPVDLGSSGGGSYAWYAGYARGGSGGGALRIQVDDTLNLNGEITANGEDSYFYSQWGYPASGGGGAGGSIYVETAALKGNGRFSADGGKGAGGGGGGGGRVAIYYNQASEFNSFAASTASGGATDQPGAPGTIAFFDRSVPNLHARLWRNFALGNGVALRLGQISVIGGALTFGANANLIVMGRCDLVGGSLSFGNDSSVSIRGDLAADGTNIWLGGGSLLAVHQSLELAGGAVLTLGGKDVSGMVDGRWAGTGAVVTAGNLTVQAGSRISADEQGYVGTIDAPAVGPGAPNGGGGAGHGNSGQTLNASTLGGAAYDSLAEPVCPGSGGSAAQGGHPHSWNRGGNGGGVIRLNVSGRLQLDGEITANGGDGVYNTSWFHLVGGSGGAIYVETHELAGTGRFAANAGASQNGGGASAGGRVAVYYNQADSFTGFASSSANGGIESVNGTVIFFDRSVPGLHARAFGGFWLGPQEEAGALRYGRLSVDGGNFVLPNDSRLTIDEDFALDHGAQVFVGGGSYVRVGGVLRLAGQSELVCGSKNNGAMVEGKWAGQGVTLRAGNLVVESGSRIHADAQGYRGGWGGLGAGPGTPGGDTVGAGYGGRGGSWNGNAYGGPAYGFDRVPLDLGSGAGGSAGGQPYLVTAGGHGGGALRVIVSGRLTLDGEISARGGNGQQAGWNSAGGGSGGSVLVETADLDGAGVFGAAGGDAARGGWSAPCGGGGGRVAIYALNGIPSQPPNVAVQGGWGDYVGEAGSVVWSAQPYLAWVLPTRTLLHGTVKLQWQDAGILYPERTTVSITARAKDSEGVFTLGRNLPLSSSIQTDTTLLPNGQYELRAAWTDSVLGVLGEAVRAAAINNDDNYSGGALADQVTWPSGRVIVVEDNIVIGAGGRLLIEPRTIVKFLYGVGITVQEGGVLDVPATSLEPVILTSIADDTAGGDTNQDGGATLPAVGDWAGLSASGSGAINLTEYVEIRYTIPAQVSGTLAASQMWPARSIYHVTGTLQIPSGVTLTILPGAIVKFDPLQGIEVQPGGALVANGNAARPIVFTSILDDSAGGDTNGDGDQTTPQPGDWRWIYCAGGEIALDHALLSFGGGDGTPGGGVMGMLQGNSGAVIGASNTILRDSFYYGAFANGGAMNLANCIIKDCSRGIQSNGGEIRAINCVVDQCSVGVWFHGGPISLTNTVISNCGTGSIPAAPDSFRYCNVWGCGTNYTGEDLTGTNGNISADPMFKDPDRDNYRPRYLSPLIDAADGAAAPAFDFMGAPRYDDPRSPNTGIPTATGNFADIGAYEFVETANSEVDLVVTSVQGPASAESATSASLTWTVMNIGAGVAAGPWHDAVTLFRWDSAGSITLSAGEVIAGTGVRLGPGQSATFTAPVRVPGGVAGAYRWQVETNVRGEVFEGKNRANNLLQGNADFILSIPEIPIGGSGNGEFYAAGEGVYFRVRPKSTSDVVLTLQSAAADAGCELYAARGYAPTRQRFDARSQEYNQPRAIVGLDNPVVDWYYVLAYPAKFPVGSASFTLRAAEVAYSLDSADLAQGSNKGAVTIPLRGTGFRPDLTALLARNGVPEAQARSVIFANSTLVFATFDLANVSPGLYDIQTEQAGVTRSLAGAFRVAEIPAGQLVTRVLMPGRLRAGRQYTAWIEYENAGGADLFAPLVLVASQSANPLRIHPAAAFANAPVEFLAIGMDGPPGILRPGQTARVEVQFVAVDGGNTLQTYFWTQETDARIDWNAVGAAIRLAPNTPESWDATWASLTQGRDSGVSSYLEFLADSVNILYGRTNVRSYNPTHVLQYRVLDEIAERDASLKGTTFLQDNWHPLGGVRVEANDPLLKYHFSAMSAADGRVRFPSMPAGNYDLTFPGYLPSANIEPAEVSPPNTVSGRLWVLRSGTQITGRITLPPGASASGGQVVAIGEDGTRYVGTLNADGTFTITGLPEGNYQIVLEGVEWILPGKPAVAASGQDASIELNLDAMAAASISGTVVDRATSAPLAGAKISTTAEFPTVMAHSTGADGSYFIQGLLPGTYPFVVTMPGYQPGMFRIDLQAGVEREKMNFGLQKAGEIRCLVKTAAGALVNGAALRLQSEHGEVFRGSTKADGAAQFSGLVNDKYVLTLGDGSGAILERREFTLDAAQNQFDVEFSLQFSELGGHIYRSGGTQPASPCSIALLQNGEILQYASSGADGSYAFWIFKDGNYDLIVLGQDFGFARRNGIPVTLAATPPAQDFVGESGQLQVTVRGPLPEEAPIASAALFLRPAGGDYAKAPSLILDTNAEGTALFPALGLGEYQLIARKNPWAETVVNFHIETTTTLTAARIRLEPGRAIAGTVRDETGAPLPYALVSFTQADGPVSLWAFANDAGRYACSTLPAGAFDITARAGGRTPKTMPGIETLDPSTTRTLDIALDSRGATVTGYVKNAAGEPLVTARVEAWTPSGVILASTYADSAGAYRLGPLPFGPVQLRASSWGRNVNQAFVSLTAGSHEKNFVLGDVAASARPSGSDARKKSKGRTTAVSTLDNSGGGIIDQLIDPLNHLHQPERASYDTPDWRMSYNFMCSAVGCDNAQEILDAKSKCRQTEDILNKAFKDWDDYYWKMRDWELTDMLEIYYKTAMLIGKVAFLQESIAEWGPMLSGASGAAANASSIFGNLIENGIALKLATIENIFESFITDYHTGHDPENWVGTMNNMLASFLALPFDIASIATNTPGYAGAIAGLVDIIQSFQDLKKLTQDAVNNDLGDALKTYQSLEDAYHKALSDHAKALKALKEACDKCKTPTPSPTPSPSATETEKPTPTGTKPTPVGSPTGPQPTGPTPTSGGPTQVPTPVPTGPTPTPGPSPTGATPGPSPTPGPSTTGTPGPTAPPITPAPTPTGSPDPGGGGNGTGGQGGDPNEKNTIGYGPEGWIAPNAAIVYTIHFENVTTATLPAQEVFIADSLNANLDAAAFQPLEIGFNRASREIPSGAKAFRALIPVDTDPYPVDSRVELDPETSTIRWSMQSYDPDIRSLPEDPWAGFLPPNTTGGDRGQGYVTYSIKPKPGLAHRTVIRNSARIVFDVNPPMDTNEVVNTIDAVPPESHVEALPEKTMSTRIAVQWSGSDGDGSGIASFDIYVSTDGGPYEAWLRGVTETSAVYRAKGSHTYGFVAVARDNTGLVESGPDGPPEAQIRVDAYQIWIVK